MSVEHSAWQPQWSAIPWLLGASAVLLAWARGPEAAHRLHRLTLLCVILAVLRVVSLWNPILRLFPYLSLLWSPHATWALSLATWLWLHVRLEPPGDRVRQPRSQRRVALLLFAVSALIYGVYTLYFCQVTMLHGDEGQYLRVTQSLLHDGDMDLSNNLEQTQINEFHVRSFDVHKAPASPEGKLYSVHPVGLSVLLAPAYWMGLHLWQNPRLATALMMALLSAGCIALSWLWLARLGMGRGPSLLSIAAMGCTVPFFAYSNQLYPDMPALLVILVVLVGMSHWQVPGGAYRWLGRWEPGMLGVAVLGLVGLGFLHPRLIVVSVALGALVFLQAWWSPRRATSLVCVGVAGVVGAGSLLAYNFAFGGDWLGPFRPGNAWAEDALDIGVWRVSLLGQWLNTQVGLINVTPVFLLCVVGWARMVVERDRRLLTVVGLYAATALVNGLHPVWTFGLCFPARFLLCAMPALLIGLSRGLGVLLRHLPGTFLFASTLALSVDGIATLVRLPEVGYSEGFLPDRLIGEYYPWAIHFVSSDSPSFPRWELAFWLPMTVAAVVALSLGSRVSRSVRFEALAIAVCLPAVWGQMPVAVSRLESGLSPYVGRLSGTGSVEPGIVSKVDKVPAKGRYHSTTGEVTDDVLVAREGEHRPGLAASLRLGFLRPGLHSVSLSQHKLAAMEGVTQGYMTVALRRTLPATSPWEDRRTLPLRVVDGRTRTEVRLALDRHTIGYAHVVFSGTGGISLQHVDMTTVPARAAMSSTEFRHIDLSDHPGAVTPIRIASTLAGMPTGAYRVHFDVDGGDLSSWFRRQPEPVAMAVYSASVTTETERTELRERAVHWFERDHAFAWSHPVEVRPQVESLQPPWWTWIPFAAEDAYSLDFVLAEESHVWFLIKYDGPTDLRIGGIRLCQLHDRESAR